MGRDARQLGRARCPVVPDGAGLMLFPILVDLRAASMPKGVHHSMTTTMPIHASLSVAQVAAIVLVHTSAMLLVMGTTAFAVYEWIGLKIPRSTWINLDAIRAGALIAAGAPS